MAKARKNVLHWNQRIARLWNYSNGLILRSFKPTHDILWADIL